MLFKDVVLTDELREKLKSSLGFSVNATFKYVQKIFREKDSEGNYIIPKEVWPIWTLKSKDGIEAAQQEDSAGFMTLDETASTSKLHLESGRLRIKTLQDGIISVTNYPFEDGRTLNFDAKTRQVKIMNENGEVKDDNWDTTRLIRHLKQTTQIELQNAINERSTLTQEELQGLE